MAHSKLKRAASILASPAVGAYKGAVASGVAPSVSTVKGALRGDKTDIAKVAVAAAAVVPAERVIARGRQAERAALVTRSLIADATTARRVAAAGDVNPYLRMAGRAQRLSQAPAGTSLRARSLIAGGEAGALQPGKILAFPDTLGNAVRRIKGRVMGTIAQTGETATRQKIAATAEEITKLGGKPPVGPFTAATSQKMAAVRGELSRMSRGQVAAARIKQDFEAARQSPKLKRVVKTLSDESGALRLPGTEELSPSEVKQRLYLASGTAGLVDPLLGGANRARRSNVVNAYMKVADVRRLAKLHPDRLPKN